MYITRENPAISFIGGKLNSASHSWAGADMYTDVDGCSCAVVGTCPSNYSCRADDPEQFSSGGKLIESAWLINRCVPLFVN